MTRINWIARGDAASTAEFTESEDGHTLTVDIDLIDPAQVFVDYTVTTDFEAAPPTTSTAPPQPAPVEAVAPTPVPARVVTFTG